MAQYGTVASLPYEFKAQGGNVRIRLSPRTDGLEEVTLGTKSLLLEATGKTLESIRTSVAAQLVVVLTLCSLNLCLLLLGSPARRDELKAEKEIRDPEEELRKN